MFKRSISVGILTALGVLSGCGVSDTRDEVVYPYTQPVPRAASYRGAPPPPAAEPRTSGGVCPGDAEELAPGSICPPTAKCYDISGGRRCIEYAK